MDGGHKGKGTDQGFRAVSRSKSQTRHDTIKTVINSFCMTSTLRSECEVYGLFKDLIPVEALENEVDLKGGGADKDYFQISKWRYHRQLGNLYKDLQN